VKRNGHFFVVVAALALLTGAAAAAEPTGTLRKIATSGAMVIGHREASRPFSFLDEAGNPAGYSIDLCRRIAEAVKDHLGLPALEVKYVPLTAENRFDKIADGSVDLECGNDTITLSRQEQVDFSNMIFITGASLLSRADRAISGVADLAGRSVSVVAGTTTEKALEQRLENGIADARVVKVKDHNEGIAALDSGRVDAHAGDQLILVGLAKAAADPGRFVLATELYSYEPYALALRRDDADFRLVANRTLARLYRSGEIGAVYDRWFGDWGGRPSQLLIALYALNGIPE
jgi:ABC-type amino acid transport substrate-binding protein